MDLGLGLCQPSTAILLVSVAGVLYHLMAGDVAGMIWWIMVGLFGTGIFQVLCYGGLEPVAWILMSIPVLIVCFFLAVALFASRMRIEDIRKVNCDRCKKPHRHHERCGGSPGCGGSSCLKEGFVGAVDDWDCPRCKASCKGSACPYCDYQASVCADCSSRHSSCDCGGRGCNRCQALSEY
jgi:hypothetical protein